MLKCFNWITGWREIPVPNDFHSGYLLHSTIATDYFKVLSGVAHFPEWPNDWWSISSHKEMFVVPRLDQNDDRIKGYQLLQGFLSFLLRLLYHNTDKVDDRIQNLEKELRYLLTILGDISWMLADSNELEAEFRDLLAEFEAVANRAGGFVHFLLFSTRRSFKQLNEELAAVFNRINLLTANLRSRDISMPAYMAAKTSTVNSLLIINSLVDDLEDLMKQGNDRYSDVKHQINHLHQGLLLFSSSINDMRSQEIGELKEPLMRMGDVAQQAEYLITAFLVKDAPLWYVIKRLTVLNFNIEQIQTELPVIIKRYQLEGLKVEKYLRAEQSSISNEIIVGFEDKAMAILDQLVGGGRDGLQVISIFGMPGLGKTTLAKKLYSHPLVNYTFQKLSWCVVSQTFKRQSALANILIQINGDLDKDRILEMEEETLVENVYKTLKGRRFLIVLDDVWDSNVWYKLRRCFPSDENGSRILFTNRNRDVAPPNSIIHELPFLSDEQCWELLKKKVFSGRACPPKLQQIGMKISAKCGGLPLTVVVVAGILSTVDQEESKWEKVEGSLASYIVGEDNAVMQILELSYENLKDHLKPCFLYFGAFAEDREISVKKLMRSWVAQGFIKEKEKRKEEIGREYLMDLIDKSLVMVVKRSSDGRGVKACVVHDLLREMCLKKCEEECFLKYTRRNFPTMYDEDQHLRSLYGRPTETLYARDMRSLRVLSCYNGYGVGVNGILGIEYLVNLRSLVVGKMCGSIDRLPKLEYLSSPSLRTVYLHSSILKTNRLRCLSAKNLEYSTDRNGWGTNSLESLSWITIKERRDEELLKYSPRLRQLKCRYKLQSKLEKMYPHFDLSFLAQLHSLSLKFYSSWWTFKLKEFRFPSTIKKLTLMESRLSWEKMSIIGRLENLEVLKLLAGSVVGERWDTGDGEFRKLRFLKMEDLLFSEWMVESDEHFPVLQHLILKHCRCLNEIPREISEVTTLVLIEVKGNCGTLVVESAERIKEEQLDMGNECLRVIINTTDDRLFCVLIWKLVDMYFQKETLATISFMMRQISYTTS